MPYHNTHRLISNVFTEDYKKTIGADFLEKALFVPALGEDVRLFCWDTLNKDYYRGARALGAVPSWPGAECSTWQHGLFLIAGNLGAVPTTLSRSNRLCRARTTQAPGLP